MRFDGRKFDQIRPVNIVRNYTKYADGSVYIEVGDTKVICNVSIEEKVPLFLRGKGEGWITCEYSMLPRATQIRKMRDITKGKIDGRTVEIQRLIGRTLRSVVDLKALGEKTLWVDCDVIQADGGTRTTAITGAFIAIVEAINKLHKKKDFKIYPIRKYLSAVSVGIVNNEKLLDLCYEEDSNAQVDMNIIMTDDGQFVEIQGTGEQNPFSRKDMNELIDLAEIGVKKMIQIQKRSLKNDALWIGTGGEI
ncbi:ribonuclease PH [Clostridium pasteurianum DSM 525 = ATCC 6013]|uniref:Ribonuclease PH n=1 Tax=Clostridium pasteurianum DSM 525 = ATCC 6013 TaxID=1262449 RepID=A0A0H3J1Z5_CLOPA|nr:ribonuclease PH [Clostridium pasteurianum]AJA47444.1 ribonuclease PH [Clostridium pasteurianum DSM 525 = ATCC 6013]AJA51432.1 ribonuclease PH [Clostridium pasteurianum DSM 525 = ATCC 6013]AOZ74770.1 ribonuclease PH [Clostridium pasteurianum DSM 525 = ATCC 6013]AOZ78566.1 ribonuclease PH [Clostridium pasteurianum]ELP58779.1 ribonuclease PH [Clostridium pasteurianum DSM 525 = ATCC 6013]